MARPQAHDIIGPVAYGGPVPEMDDAARAKLLRQFETVVSGSELADLRQLAGDLLLFGGAVVPRPARPDLRRSPRPEPATYRIRVDLDGAKPPIWRRLDLRSDLPLDVVHQVLQAAFGWTDSHLHRFALGGHPFDLTSQLFLCPYDVEEGEEEDEDGIPAADVRLDETLNEPGDMLRYLYDYGDSWELTLRLEAVLPATSDAPAARAVGGRRAAPPEDSGGGTDLASLAFVVEDPAAFDLDEVNDALRSTYFLLREHRVDPRLVDLVHELTFSEVGEDLTERALALVDQPTQPGDEEMAAALTGYRWFLDRAAQGGIALTSAGYLRPADVEAACAVVPAMGDWIGKNNRENQAFPLLEFRRSLQSLGLLRKHKGMLVLTRAGAAAQRDPARLWQHLADRLIPSEKAGRFDLLATLLLLAYAGTSADAPMPRDEVAQALTELGWLHRDRSPVTGFELYHLTAYNTLVNVAPKPVERGARHWVSPAAAALARAALRR